MSKTHDQTREAARRVRQRDQVTKNRIARAYRQDLGRGLAVPWIAPDGTRTMTRRGRVVACPL